MRRGYWLIAGLTFVVEVVSIATGTATKLTYIALALCTTALLGGLWMRLRKPKPPCSWCYGQRFFVEPTNFGDPPNGMQRITCPECKGRP